LTDAGGRCARNERGNQCQAQSDFVGTERAIKDAALTSTVTIATNDAYQT
jgi:hypothetical protein